MTTGVRKRLLGGLAVTAITGALTLSGGNVGAQPANPVTLTLMPATLTPPGTVTARVEILGSVPTTNTINLLVIATDAQLGPPVLVNGSWQPGTCTGEGTPFIQCPFSSAVYPITLDFTISAPAGAAPGRWSVVATVASGVGGANAILRVQAPPTTTTTTTTAGTTTTAVVTPTSVTPPTSMAVASTSAEPATLPGTGSSTLAPFVAIAVLAGGAVLTLLARRSRPAHE
jgi:hypothetical protein